jgi:hypothetical protein
MKHRVLAAAVLACLATPTFAGPACDANTTKGTWVARCEGDLATPGGVVNSRLLATCNASKDNYWICAGNTNAGGQRVEQALRGQAVVNADCTGFISYQQTINGFPAPQIDIDYVVLENGDEIWGLPRPAAPGEVVACSLKRLSKSPPR